jgi:hypothetical protein
MKVGRKEGWKNTREKGATDESKELGNIGWKTEET